MLFIFKPNFGIFFVWFLNLAANQKLDVRVCIYSVYWLLLAFWYLCKGIWISYQKFMISINVLTLCQYRELWFWIGIMCKISSTLNRDTDINFRCGLSSVATVLRKMVSFMKLENINFPVIILICNVNFWSLLALAIQKLVQIDPVQRWPTANSGKLGFGYGYKFR